MTLFAVNAELLGIFNNLLHDLYIQIPSGGFEVKDERTWIDFVDWDHCIHRDFAATYRLYVYSILSLESRGDISRLPGNEAQLNKIKFRDNIVQFECVHPFQLICKVKELRLGLDQVDSPSA